MRITNDDDSSYDIDISTDRKENEIQEFKNLNENNMIIYNEEI